MGGSWKPIPGYTIEIIWKSIDLVISDGSTRDLAGGSHCKGPHKKASQKAAKSLHAPLPAGEPKILGEKSHPGDAKLRGERPRW